MGLVVWIIVGSLICTLAYWIIARDYLFYDAMWSECFFPGVIVWRKLSEEDVSLVSKIIATLLISVILFMHTIIIILFFIGFIIGCVFENLVRCIFKKR